MAVKYYYASQEYQSEDDAQAAVVTLKGRLENNPTDWMEVKEITESADGAWQVNPTKLTDSQILNPDNSKTYMAYGKVSGIHVMPLTSTDLMAKINEFRAFYGQHLSADVIYKFDDSTEPPTETTITPTTDMSVYMIG